MELAEFFEFMYGKEQGYVYVALKNPNSGAFLQHYYEWPAQADKLIEKVEMSAHKYEVYYAPSLFRTGGSAQKSEVLGSNVVWVEFDGRLPNLAKFENIPAPALRIRSSDDSHEHWYWRLDSISDPESVEKINRSLTYLLGADVSGWDAGQILRPPGTRNHKRGKNVELISVSGSIVSLTDFSELPEPPPVGKTFEASDIPDVLDVIAKSKWRKSLWKLFREGVPEGRRSEGLMALGHGLAEAGLSEAEMLSVLVNADQRWGKFANRSDQIQRLSEIVTRAKLKHPGKVSTETTLILPRFTFQALLDSDIRLEWVWQNYLQEKGYFLLSGPPGVGKTQFSLGFAMAAALGKKFLNQPVASPKKIGFYSLEMPAPDLKHFVTILSQSLTDEEKTLLEQNLVFFPYGEPLYLTDETVQKMIFEQVGDEKFEGVILDSMMAATDRSVSDDETAKKLVDWDAHLRSALGTFTWWITHQRKEQVGNKKPVHLGDVYGSVHITRQATTCFCLWREQEAEDKNKLEVIPMKVRLSATPGPFNVYRSADLTLSTESLGGLHVVSNSDASTGDGQSEVFNSGPPKV